MSFDQAARQLRSAGFASFGEPAVRWPGGGGDPVSMTVLRSVPDEAFDLVGRPVRLTATALRLTAEDAVAVADGDVIEVGVETDVEGLGVPGTGERRVVQGDPQAADSRRLTFRIDTRPE